MGAELEAEVLGPVATSRRQRRAAALHIADSIAAQHPHLTAKAMAADPAIAAGIRELLAALGLDSRRTP